MIRKWISSLRSTPGTRSARCDYGSHWHRRRLRVERLEGRSLLAVVDVVPFMETAKTSAADDVAIWIHPTDTAQSTVIGTAKKSSQALRVFDLAGNLLQTVETGRINNVDLRYNFPLDGKATTLLIGSNRSNDTLDIYRVDPQTRLLENVSARPITTGIDVYGAAMYVSPTTGKYYAFLSSESGAVQQWELFDNGAGLVDATQVRGFFVGSVSEGLVADDALGHLYVGQENVGIWKYSAEPNGGDVRIAVDNVGSPHLAADVEGLAIYYVDTTTGYLIASSQGSDDFAIYRRDGSNEYLGSFRLVADAGIDKVTNTDGIDVTNAALGSHFPSGMFVAQDNDQNFKLVRWDTIVSAVGNALSISTTWDPRLVGSDDTNNQSPVVSAGADQTIALSASAVLNATVADDSSPIHLSGMWSVVSGPGNVIFANATAVDTTATFSQVGEYVLKLTVSDGFVSASDELTIVVDEDEPPSPTPDLLSFAFQDGVSPSGIYAGTRDTTLAGSGKPRNYGAAGLLTTDGSPDRAVLLSWDVSAVPVGSSVDSASITLYVTDKSKHAYPVYALTRKWNELEANWSNADAQTPWLALGATGAADRSVVVIGTLVAPVKGPATIELNAAGIELVQSWVDTPSTNFGIMIENYAASNSIDFASREAPNAANRPRLNISISLAPDNNNTAASRLGSATAIAQAIEIERQQRRTRTAR